MKFFRYLAAITFSFFFFSTPTLANKVEFERHEPFDLSELFQSNLEETVSPEADSSGDRCEIVVIILSENRFSSDSDGRQFCSRLSKLFQDNLCFTRGYGDKYHSTFRYEKRFRGNYFDSWNSYFNWSRSHLFRGVGFRHDVRFSKGC